MALERTLALIKPDAVANNFIGKILALIIEQDLRIIAAKMKCLSIAEADTLYAEHKDKPFYPPLIEFMTSAPVMVQVLEGENAVQVLRDIMGATNPQEATAGTIRQLYAANQANGAMHKNAIHGSDSIDSARREIDFFFTADEIYTRS